MINKKIEKAINDQITSEMYSGNLYLVMSAYCETLNLSGFAQFFRKQNEEEMSHALKLFDYLLNRNAKIDLGVINKPPSKYKSLTDVFKQFYEHEKAVTGMINDIYALSVKENDYPTQVEMQWFVSEQVEEEKTALALLEKVKMAGEDGPALLLLDTYVIHQTESGSKEA